MNWIALCQMICKGYEDVSGQEDKHEVDQEPLRFDSIILFPAEQVGYSNFCMGIFFFHSRKLFQPQLNQSVRSVVLIHL